ncbi:MAG: hypothetical protein QGI06_00025 [Rhodospirillales bacterium]|jgi:hypothetical protein|nr:hypothetical protein [Rhodospirillales bacterium]
MQDPVEAPDLEAPDVKAPDVKAEDSDRDSLHILPLFILPLETTALKRARLIKNVRLKGVIELFEDEQAGSGQIGIENLALEFGWPEDQPHPDLIMLRKLGLASSYDVYSLRLTLRELEIPVNNYDELRLSEEKAGELSEYMTAFTRPLIMQIFGDDDVSIQDFEDVIALFRDPDIAKARQKLQTMADKLGVKLQDVPKFLEDYGDIFLSLSYYRQCLDAIEPAISGMIASFDDLRTNWQLKNDHSLMQTCDMIESTVNGMLAAITGRFENFDRSTGNMWDNITAERFRQVEKLIKDYHTTIGGVLCALSVKMDAWARLFPEKDVGGPVKRAEFIMSDIKPGIDTIQNIEDSAPMLAALN